MENSKKIILDLCGGTGSWSRPYKEAGYDVRLITLPDYNVTDVIFSGDYMVFNKQTYDVNDMGIKYADVYGIFAAPPCTEFSLAKGNRLRDFESGMKVVEACLQIIWKCRMFGNLKFWAMENPRGFLRQFIGIPRYTFEQWQFGGDKRKATDIWGYFKKLTPTVKEFPLVEYTKRNPCGSSNGRAWGKREYPLEYADYIESLHGYTAQRAAARAITPPGFAQAFFKANK